MYQHSESGHQQDQQSSSLPWILGSAVIGALAMYLGDPNRGRRRRALAVDQVRSATLRARDVVGMAGRDLNNRLHGLAAQAKRLAPGGGSAIDDPVLQARVRQKIGRMVSNPHSIKVSAEAGCITLRGPVLEAEHRTLLNTVRAVPGVTEVADHLDAHDVLPGVTVRPARRDRDDTLRNDWPPASRALTLLGGGTLGTLGLLRRSPWASVLALAGLGLVARSLARRPGARTDAATGDPKRQLEDDLMRMKQFIESGQVPTDPARRGETAHGPLH